MRAVTSMRAAAWAWLVCAASATAAWKRQPCGATVGTADIVTRWGATVDPAVAAPLLEYPRPQLVRGRGGASSWMNLNGLWQWEPASGVNGTASGPPPFGRRLNRSILVPFPPESCLSGIRENHAYMWYRLVFDAAGLSSAPARLHFGAIDWQSKVWLNGELLGSHTGGYDGFSFEAALAAKGNELLVYAHDPSGPPSPFTVSVLCGAHS